MRVGSTGEPEDRLPGGLDRLTQVPLLNAEDEGRLTRAARAGDERAKERLVEANMRLVINIARGYRSRQIPLEDLIQEGAIGLMQAIERFDPDRGFRFSTYATHWIRQAIGRAIDNKSKSIRLPAHVAQSLRKVEKIRQTLLYETGYEPSQDQIAQALGIAPNRLQTLLLVSRELVSLELEVGDGGATLGTLIRDPNAVDAESTILSAEVLLELRRILSELDEREQRVMRHRYRFEEDEEPEAELELSRNRIRQIEAQAVRKLRAIVQQRRLGEVFGRDLPDAS
ncbi:sigma-70 family RNA polymerase sigma factor [bacterium]|nr:MAG: sigma-70 family RNA polymerase sigma factor [bacterium]